VQLLKTSFRRKLGAIENTTLAVGTLGGVALAIAC
jgi:hypothetical protein